MKPQYFIAILFATSLYWMYLLYSPFILTILIAALLAISTSSIQSYLENIIHNIADENVYQEIEKELNKLKELKLDL